MAHPAYRKAPGTEWIIVVLCLLAVAGEIAMVPMLGPRRMTAFDLVYFAIPLIMAFVLGWMILRRKHRQRMARLAKNLQAAGLQATLTPDKEKCERLWNYVKPLAQVLDLRGGGPNVQWYATLNGHTDPLCLFEFRFVTGSGRYSQEHIRTVIIWLSPLSPAPDQSPGDLPGFVMSKLPWLQRRAQRTHALVLPGHEALAKTWIFHGDAGTAARVLKPAVLAELTTAPKGECWYVGHGWFCCCFQNALHPDDVGRFLERSRQMLKLVSEGTQS